jgi:S1-C subfamily serine protease
MPAETVAVATPVPAVEPERHPLTPLEIAERNRDAVVLVRAKLAATPFSQPGLGTGTGIVFEHQGRIYILTAEHVVSGASSIGVVVAGGGVERPARRIGVSSCDDIAVLAIDDTSGLTPATFGASGDLRNGEQIVVMGFPLNAAIGGDEPSVTSGIVSQAEREFEQHPSVVQHDAQTDGGYSGGPLFNSYGEVVGVHVMRVGNALRFAVSMDYTAALLGDLVGGARLNYTGMNLTPFALEDGLRGLLVEGVDARSPAAEAQVRPADLLLTVDGQPMTSVADLCRLLRSRSDGDAVRTTMVRLDAERPFVLEGELRVNTLEGNWLRPVVEAQGTAPAPTAAPAPADRLIYPLALSDADLQKMRADYDQLYRGAVELHFQTFDNSNTKHYWYEQSDATRTVRFAGGVYQHTLQQPGAFSLQLLRVHRSAQFEALPAPYLLEVDLAFGTGGGNNAGIVADYQANGDGIYFYVSSDGTWSVTTVVNGAAVATHSLPATRTNALVAGTNQLRLTRLGNSVIFWANNTPLGALERPPFSGGHVGVVASSFVDANGPVTVLFDHFRVRR